MARRKSKKIKKNRFKGIKTFFSGVFQLTLKVVPLVVLIMLGSTVFMGVRSALYADSNLLVQQVLVEPSQALSVETKQRLEAKHIGENILKVDLKSIARELEKNPHIQRASVTRQFPADLKVQIDERMPIGLIQFSTKGSYGLISDDGMILDVLKGKTNSFLVFEAYHTGLKTPRVGVRVKTPGFHEAARFVRGYWKHPMAQKEPLTRMSLDRVGNVIATLGSGPALRLGRKPADRLYAIEKTIPILESSDRKKIDYIDLQYDDVIVKRKGR